MSTFVNFSSGEPLAMLPSSSIIALERLSRAYPIFELTVVFLLYYTFAPTTAAYLKGFPASRKARAIGLAPVGMVVHVLVSTSCLARYYSRLLPRLEEPTSSDIDLVLGLLQFWSALYLAKHTRSPSTLYKSSFQVMSLINAVAHCAARITLEPAWYRTSIKCIEWFLVFRVAALAIRKYHLFDHPRVPDDALLHFVSVPITLVWAHWAEAIPVWLVATAVWMQCAKWVLTSSRWVDLSNLVEGGGCCTAMLTSF